MAHRKADILIFKSLNVEQLGRLIDQLSYVDRYDELVDYIYDHKELEVTINNTVYKKNDKFHLNISNIYNSQLTTNLKKNDLVVNDLVLVKYVKPIYCKPNYHIGEIFDGEITHQIEIYYGYMLKIELF